MFEPLEKQYNPQGFNTGMNIGQSAGAGVADHYHLHIIPRWSGDSNFMPLIGKTKVVLEDLHTSYEKLLSYFEKVREK
jgi:ATP adenylyltransferase